ncbi:hypothetical protein OSTOST_08246 [Ostertagia ostertagi]
MAVNGEQAVPALCSENTAEGASKSERVEEDSASVEATAQKIEDAQGDSTAADASSNHVQEGGTDAQGDSSAAVAPSDQIEEEKAEDKEASTTAEAAAEKIEGFSTRFLNEKWIGRYDATQEYVEFHNNEWRPLPTDDLEFIQQLWYEQEAAETQVVNGVKMKWNPTKQEWERVEETIDEDFIASYQANYGVPYDYSKLDEERKAAEAERAKSNKSAERREKKARDAAEAQVQPDARTNKPKLKLYVDEQGQLKGDGRCCYIKKESVDLALSILDGYVLKGKEVHVEKARFELKGEFDPSKEAQET